MTIDVENLNQRLQGITDQVRRLRVEARETIDGLTRARERTFEDGQRDITERYLRYLQSQPCTNNDHCTFMSNVNSMCLRCRLVWFMNAETRDLRTPAK